MKPQPGRGSTQLPAALPLVAVVAVVLAVWALLGVGFSEIVLFLGYEAVYVLLPGVLLLRVLSPERSRLEQLTLGWALGLAVEILAFMATAEVGARGALAFYPLCVIPLAFLALRQRRREALPVPAVSAGERWTLAALSLAALAYFAAAYFTRTPLPWQVGAVSYPGDVPFHLALAAEARHHWPVLDPNIAGQPFPYHLWAHFDMAAVSQVTGIALPVVLLRLTPVVLVLLFVALAAVAGRSVSGRPWAGPLAAALAVFAGELDFGPKFYDMPFYGYFPWLLWLSPTLLLGLVFFLPAVQLLHERLRDRGPARRAWGDWVLLLVFLVACAGAKATILPVVVGGLTLLALFRLARRRPIDPALGLGLLLSGAVFAVYYLLLYRGTGSLGLGWAPFATVLEMPYVAAVRAHFPHGVVADHAFWVFGGLLGLVGSFGAALMGLAWRARRLTDDAHLFLVGALVAGLVPFFLLRQFSFSQSFFTDYGLVAACLLSADGLSVLAVTGRAHHRVGVRTLFAFCAAWTLSLVMLATGTLLTGALRRSLSYSLALAGLALILGLLSSVRLPSGRRPRALVLALAGLLVVFAAASRRGHPAFAPYGFLLAGLAVLLVAAFLARGADRAALLALATVAVVSAGMLNLPIDYAPDAVTRLHRHERFYGVDTTRMTARLYRALSWIRENTPEDAVLAANNYDVRSGRLSSPSWFEYAAFAERRVFLEGWGYSQRAYAIGATDVFYRGKVPFPRRLRLNEAVFRDADRRALATLVRRYGVRFLLVDRVNGRATPRVRRLGRVVFANPAAFVVAVGPVRGG